MLPELAFPTYTTNLISDNKEIEYRPWLAKEQKILLMALESRDMKDVTDAVLNILKSCILTDIDIKKLPSFDIQHIFLCLRKVSVSEVVEVKLKCDCGTEEKPHFNALKLNLNNVRTEIPEGHTRKIKLNDTIGVIMRYPNEDMIADLEKEDTEVAFSVIARCIESVFDEETVYSDFTEAEMNKWIGNLNSEQMLKIVDFFKNAPKLVMDVKYKCTNCQKESEYRLEGLSDFFM
jgi:hypothetical protein